MVDRSMLVVHDESQACPYLPDQTARMPLQWPAGILTPREFDQFLERGFRRSGVFLYQTRCENCQACEPTRVDVTSLRWSSSLRRVLKRGDRTFRTEVGPPEVDDRRVELMNAHRIQRRLHASGEPLDKDDYRAFLVDSCCDTLELRILHEDQLIGVAITDVGAASLSAVYCYFDPQWSRFSLGTYAILKQFQYAVQTGRQLVYLGMYVSTNPHLNYKSRFVPQQRRVAGQWLDFAGDS